MILEYPILKYLSKLLFFRQLGT